MTTSSSISVKRVAHSLLPDRVGRLARRRFGEGGRTFTQRIAYCVSCETAEETIRGVPPVARRVSCVAVISMIVPLRLGPIHSMCQAKRTPKVNQEIYCARYSPARSVASDATPANPECEEKTRRRRPHRCETQVAKSYRRQPPEPRKKGRHHPMDFL